MAVLDEQKMNGQKGHAEGDQGRHADESASDAMHRLLGRLVHAYARLDHYVGLQLKWLGDYRAQPVEQLLRKTVPFDMRLRRLKKLAIETWGHTDLAVANEFGSGSRRSKGFRSNATLSLMGAGEILERVRM
jgi:hypothetical protein